jgi:hypothetical protein
LYSDPDPENAMKDTTQSQFISSSAASTTIAIFMFVTVAFIVLLGASKRDRAPRDANAASAQSPAGSGPAFEEKRRPQ